MSQKASFLILLNNIRVCFSAAANDLAISGKTSYWIEKHFCRELLKHKINFFVLFFSSHQSIGIYFGTFFSRRVHSKGWCCLDELILIELLHSFSKQCAAHTELTEKAARSGTTVSSSLAQANSLLRSMCQWQTPSVVKTLAWSRPREQHQKRFAVSSFWTCHHFLT